MKHCHITAIWAATALLGFATPVNAEEPPAPPPAAPAAAAAPDASTPAAAPAPAGTATVIFFRPSRFVGAAVGFIVREGSTDLGKLRNGKYFAVHVPPGKHDYTVHSESKDVLTIEAEAGETYYVSGSIGLGIMVGRPNLSPSDQAAFEAAKAKMKEITPMSGG
jgi:hypothetical protein